MEKDPKIDVKSFAVGESNAGSLQGDRTRYQFRFTPEQTRALINGLQAQLNTDDGAEKGTKLDIHSGQRTTRDGRRKFDAAFLFVKALQDAPGIGGKGSGPKATFTPVQDAISFKNGA